MTLITWLRCIVVILNNQIKLRVMNYTDTLINSNKNTKTINIILHAIEFGNTIICYNYIRKMGCINSRHANSYYENMLRKAILFTKAKYKTLQGDVSKQQQTIDMLALDDFGLFITGTLNHGQRHMIIDK